MRATRATVHATVNRDRQLRTLKECDRQLRPSMRPLGSDHCDPQCDRQLWPSITGRPRRALPATDCRTSIVFPPPVIRQCKAALGVPAETDEGLTLIHMRQNGRGLEGRRMRSVLFTVEGASLRTTGHARRFDGFSEYSLACHSLGAPAPPTWSRCIGALAVT